jgi:hypothetical protein
MEQLWRRGDILGPRDDSSFYYKCGKKTKKDCLENDA